MCASSSSVGHIRIHSCQQRARQCLPWSQLRKRLAHLFILSTQKSDEGVRVPNDRMTCDPPQPALEVASACLDEVGRKAAGQALLWQGRKGQARKLLGEMLRERNKVRKAALREGKRIKSALGVMCVFHRKAHLDGDLGDGLLGRVVRGEG